MRFSVDERELSDKYYELLYLRHFKVRRCFEKRMLRKINKGVTLVEVMAALVIALVIAIGVMSYQYACAQHARKSDVLVTASRLGLMFLENWAAVGGIIDVSEYDPAIRQDLGAEPLGYYLDLEGAALPDVPPWGNTFRSYRIFTNGTYFWIELAYNDYTIPGESYPIRELGVKIAWSQDFGSETLEYDPQRLVRFSKSVLVPVDN
jgi:prepilin-type N-terminal cleavage/methylation domain-containing protein